MRRLALLLLLFAWPLFAADIVVIGPPTPIQPGVMDIVFVDGMTDPELAQASVEVVPSEGVTLMPAKQWGGRPFVIFRAAKPGKYTLTVSLNRWGASVKNSLVDVKRASIDPALTAEFESVVNKLSQKYPSKIGSCVVEVAGTLPPPVDPNDPNKPPPKPDPNLPSKIDRVTYIYEEDNTVVPQGVAFALQRINADSSGSVIASDFEEDTTTGSGTVPAQYKIALEAARKVGLPALVVQSGTTVLRVVKAPTTDKEVFEAAK